MVNVNPKLWGKSAWIFLHCVVRAYPDFPSENDKANYKAFFTLLKDILPCEMCRVNYSTNLSKYNLDQEVLRNNNSLLKWWTSIRNEENKHINRGPKTAEEYDSEVLDNAKGQSIDKWLWVILSILLLLIVMAFIWIHGK
jgi:hypothetical protein